MKPLKIKFLISAEQEFVEAVNYYNSQSPGLGFEFAVEVRRTLKRIAEYPIAWHQLSKRTRRWFPLWYRISKTGELYYDCCCNAFAQKA